MSKTRDTRFFPHPEARPFRWRLFDQAQRTAFFDLVKHLARAVDLLDDHGDVTPAPGAPIKLDARRCSSNVMVSGDRGTGKTSLLLSLLQCCTASTSEHWDREIEKLQDVNGDRGDGHGLAFYDELRRDIGTLRERLCWLETLDMEVLPRPTNLLAAILARIQRRVEPLDQLRLSDPDQRGFLRHNHPQDSDPLADLGRIQRDVAIAWEGNLRERAATLDPDVYQVETRRAEVARLQFGERLSSTLANLARGYRWPDIKDPIFVLPIDDFDTNPARSVELLQMLRLLSGPRLLVVILGSISTATTMMQLKLTGEFVDIARQIGPGSAVHGEELAGLLGGTAHYTMRKLIAPSRRIRLEPMRVGEARAYKPPDLADSKSIDGLLTALPVIINTAPESHIGEDDKRAPDHQPRYQCVCGQKIRNMSEFLFFDPERDSHAERWGQGIYSGAALFVATPRYASDIWYVLLRAESEYASIRDNIQDASTETDVRGLLGELDTIQKPIENVRDATIPAIGAFATFYAEAIEEERDLNPTEKRRLLRAVRRDFLGGWEFHTDSLQPLRGKGRELEIPEEKKRKNTLLAWQVKDWDFRPERLGPGDRVSNPEQQGMEQSWRCLSDRSTATIIILHDLLALRTPTGIAGPYLTPDPKRDWAAFVEGYDNSHPRETPDSVWATTRWRLKPEVTVDVPWYPPRWRSFWQFNYLRHVWNRAVQQMRRHPASGGKRYEYLAFTWIAASTAVLTGTERFKALDSAGNPNVDALPWEKLAARVEELAKAVETHRAHGQTSWVMLAEDWLVSLVSLLAPEGGLDLPNDKGELSPTVAQIFCEPRNNPSLCSLWTDALLDSVRTQRRQCCKLFCHHYSNKESDSFFAWWLFAPTRVLRRLENSTRLLKAQVAKLRATDINDAPAPETPPLTEEASDPPHNSTNQAVEETLRKINDDLKTIEKDLTEQMAQADFRNLRSQHDQLTQFRVDLEKRREHPLHTLADGKLMLTDDDIDDLLHQTGHLPTVDLGYDK